MLETTVPLCHPLWTMRLSNYQYQAQNMRATFMHHPTRTFMKWHLCTIGICRTQKKQVSRTWYLYFYFFFLTWEHPSLAILNLQAALLYQLVENRNNSASENLGLSAGSAHHWHSLSSMSTARQVWTTLHTLYLKRSPVQQPDYFWSFLHHSNLYSEQKASPFFFLTSFHFSFS